MDEATIYAVSERFELSSSVDLILGARVSFLNSIFMILSLQSALCAYLVTFSETARNLICRPVQCESENFTLVLDDTTNAICGQNYSEYQIYIFAMIFFLIFTGPLCMMNMGDNAIIQYIGNILRWLTISGTTQ